MVRRRQQLRDHGDFDAAWVQIVRTICDPIFDAADVGFIAQVHATDTGPALLWEAGPERFAAKYTDSDIAEYVAGIDDWSSPADCVDYWVYVDARQQRAVFSVEGWDLPRWGIDLSGDGSRDGISIAREFARVLRVTGPVEQA